MKLTKTIALASTAMMLATGVFAQDIAVIAGSVEDAFMDKIKKGVDDATHMVEANGGTVQYLRTQNYENFGPDLVTLINQAVAQGVDGIAIPVWVPDAQIPALQSAAEQGIKIMQYNSGLPVKADIGAINYFGSDEYEAGYGGGKYLAEKGAKHILCHIQVARRDQPDRALQGCDRRRNRSRCQGDRSGDPAQPRRRRDRHRRGAEGRVHR